MSKENQSKHHLFAKQFVLIVTFLCTNLPFARLDTFWREHGLLSIFPAENRKESIVPFLSSTLTNMPAFTMA